MTESRNLGSEIPLQQWSFAVRGGGLLPGHNG
jgi:hypothetical protein